MMTLGVTAVLVTASTTFVITVTGAPFKKLLTVAPAVMVDAVAVLL